MRLDKYLKVSRLIKRRTVAKEVSDQGKVLINGKVGKPSDQLKIGDILELVYGPQTVKVKVLSLKETVKKEEAKWMYEILD